MCVLPEVEIFLGDVPITKYDIPGGKEFAETILPFVQKSNVIILANHGTVSFGETVERAYWWTEILDAYCRILMLAQGLGRVNYFTEPEAKALLDLKGEVGLGGPARRDEELRHLRQRRLPRKLEGDGRSTDGVRAAEFQEQRIGPGPGRERTAVGRLGGTRGHDPGDH